MSDIVLKIYSKTTNWADTLDHTLSGDVMDYRIVDNSCYVLDTATFKIADADHRWSDQITCDSWDGTNDTVQVWRAFSRDDQLISSGIVQKVNKKGNYIILDSIGMSDLLRRVLVRERFFHTKDNSGNAISGKYILIDATYGLIPDIISNTYGYIDLHTYVDTSDTTYVRPWKFDGMSVWDAGVELAKSTYGTNGKAFDFYLMETYALTGAATGGGATSVINTAVNFGEAVVGGAVYNVSDDSWAVITSVSTATNPNDTVNFTGGLVAGYKVGGDHNLDFAASDTYYVQVIRGGNSYLRHLYFRERESSAKAKTIRTSDLYLPEFSLAEHNRGHYNKVYVRGEINPQGQYPTSMNEWRSNLQIGLTATIHDGGPNSPDFIASGGDFVNDGVTTDMWVSNVADGCWGEITAVSATTLTCGNGLNDGGDADFDNTDGIQVGYGYVGAATNGAGATMLVTSNYPQFGSNAVELHRSDTSIDCIYVINNWGTNIDSKYTRLKFWAKADTSGASSDHIPFYIAIGVKDRYGNKNKDGNDITQSQVLTDQPNHELGIQTVAVGGSVDDVPFTFFDLPLPKPGEDNGWDDAEPADTFNVSGIETREWYNIYQVAFFLNGGDNIQNMVIAGLHFTGNVPYSGSAFDGAGAQYLKEYAYFDDGLKSNTACTNMAQNILPALNRKQYESTCTFKGVARDFSIKAGNTAELVVPSKGINFQVGQTVTKLPIQRIEYRPYTQTLTLGRIYSEAEIVNQIARSVKRAKKIH